MLYFQSLKVNYTSAFWFRKWKIYIHNNDHVIIKDHGIVISHNELKIIFYTLLFTKVYFSVHPVLLKSIIKAALHLTAYNKTFGCNPYTQNIDVMKNKDVELIDTSTTTHHSCIISSIIRNIKIVESHV